MDVSVGPRYPIPIRRCRAVTSLDRPQLIEMVSPRSFRARVKRFDVHLWRVVDSLLYVRSQHDLYEYVCETNKSIAHATSAIASRHATRASGGAAYSTARHDRCSRHAALRRYGPSWTGVLGTGTGKKSQVSSAARALLPLTVRIPHLHAILSPRLCLLLPPRTRRSHCLGGGGRVHHARRL